MKRRTPEQAGLQPLEALPPVGRARCFRQLDGELNRLPADDPARSPLRWGMARGVGTFVAAGEDEYGAWFVARTPATTLWSWLKSSPDPELGLRVFARLAQLLDCCEREGVFPGPLLPDAVLLDEREAEPSLVAGDWVRALFGAEPEPFAAERHNLRFFPPEQAAGAAWDESANRYAFGLLFYQLLAAEPAFAGQGLRLSLEARSQQAPAALAPERARLLPPGVQSLALRLLSPDPGERPATADAIARELRRYTMPRAAGREPAPLPVQEAAPRSRDPERSSRRALPLSLFALLAGTALVALVLGLRSVAGREATGAARSRRSR